MEAHQFVKGKALPWSFCAKCGLVTVNNKFTEWAIKKGCDYKDHSSYASTRERFTKLF